MLARVTAASPALLARAAPLARTATATRTTPPVRTAARKAVLLENVHPSATALLEAQGFEVDNVREALSGQELVERAGNCHVLGIRSKTQLPADFFDSVGWHERRLLAVGCFCIGTNQVDLAAAAARGVAVFNAPFSNTRSVAEKTIGEVVALRRRLFERSMQLHAGEWQKSAQGAHEVRGTVLGVVGYGRIGSQVSVLAELLGMRVIFYDPLRCLPLGNAQQVDSMVELLAAADVVTLHVPATPSTREMIDAAALARMRPGALLINNARGSVVDVEALADALRDGHVGGAAVDVFPVEPKSNGAGFESPLRGLPQAILTPHVGGSTEEAQGNIGVEVAEKLVRFVAEGSSQFCVNLPEVNLPPPHEGAVRILHLHNNVPGVLSQINSVLSELNVNVLSQFLQSNPDQGLVALDIEPFHVETVVQRLSEVEETLFTRRVSE